MFKQMDEDLEGEGAAYRSGNPKTCLRSTEMKIPSMAQCPDLLKAVAKDAVVYLENRQLEIEGSLIHRGRAAHRRSIMRLLEGLLEIAIYYVENSAAVLDVVRGLDVVIRFRPFFACARTCCQCMPRSTPKASAVVLGTCGVIRS